jgi:hypothetical protein
MERFEGWLHRRRVRNPNTVDVDATPPLPTLPTCRPRRLSTCDETANDPNVATSASPFFQLLPPEIRRDILISAFGDRTLHLDLRLVHPPKKAILRRFGIGSSSGGSDKRDFNAHANVYFLLHQGRDESQPRRWEWWSCVCHRLRPSEEPEASLPGNFELSSENPANDRCRSGYYRDRRCNDWPGEVPAKCQVGVMGWLLACRAAYVEGLDVLYATNKFHFAGTFLCRHLPELLLPSRLAAITRAEMVWDLRLWKPAARPLLAEDHPPDLPGVEGYRALVAALPEILPNLRFLYVSLTGIPIDAGGGLEDVPELLLQPLDAMLQSSATLQDFRVGVPSSVFKELALARLGVSDRSPVGGRGLFTWLPAVRYTSSPEVQNGPENEHKDPKNQEHGRHYWLYRGQKDLAEDYMVCGLGS